MSYLLPSIIIDDQRTDVISLTGPHPWSTTNEPEWFNGTSQSPVYALNGSGLFGLLDMKFHGTSVAFFGVTPPIFTNSQILTVSIDGNTPYNTSYSDPNPQSYRQWYQSPTLPDGLHTISLSHISGTSLDYAVVTVGPSTLLINERIIVDNDDPGIFFNGSWRRSQDMFNSGPQPDGFPFHNTTHQSTNVGDNFTYRFAGSSAAIYGIFSWANLGVLQLNFTLDGASLLQTYRVNSDTPQFISELGQQQNFLFYSYDFLQPGNHTLIVSLTECVNQTFSFDYITYKPSFSNLSSLPDFPHNSSTISSSNITGGGSSTRHTFVFVAVAASAVLVFIVLGIIHAYLKHRKIRSRIYEPFSPFSPLRRPEVTVTPGLLSGATPPRTTYSDSSSMVPMQSFSAPQQNASSSTLQNGHEDTSTLNTPNANQLSGSSAGRNSTWSSIYAETSPPSYDETTRGQPPPTITYLMQR